MPDTLKRRLGLGLLTVYGVGIMVGAGFSAMPVAEWQNPPPQWSGIVGASVFAFFAFIGLSCDILRFPCEKGAADRHLKYAGQRRRLDRRWLGLRGPFRGLISRRLFHEA